AGEYDRAVRWLRESLKVDWSPGEGGTYSALAMAHHRLAQPDEARQALTTAAKLIDKSWHQVFQSSVGGMPFPWWNLLESCLLYKEAENLSNGFPPPEDPRLYVVRARAFVALHDVDRADAACAQAMELQPRNLQIRHACFHLCTKQRRWDKATAYAKAVEPAH